MKTALVVGGSSGIGLAIVKQLLEQDYYKIYIYDRKILISYLIKLNLLSSIWLKMILINLIR